MSLRFNTFRAKRYLRSKFVEGKYLLASEASDIELEVLDVLRRVVKDTIGDVALEDAWKVELLSSTQLLIKPGEAWFSGLPFQFRSGKDQLVSGAVLSAGVLPVGVVITDDATGLGKIITLNSGSTTPTNNYRIVITAKEELLTEVEDPFLQNANLTESTAQKVRLKFQINLVPESLQTEAPIPYRDESSTSLVVTNFPNTGGLASPNLVNQVVVTPVAAGNGELVNLQLITGSEKIDGRDVEITLRNDSTIGGGHPIPKSPTEQVAFENGKLVDSNGNMYHINAIFNDVVSTQVVIRLDKEPNQPNPEIINTKPFTLIKRDVYATDGVNGQPQGKLFWNIATVDWHEVNELVHESKIVDLRTSVSKLADLEMQLLKRDNLALLGGGNVSFDLNNSVLNWPTAFKIMNPHGLSQTIAANSVVLADGGSLAYEMNLASGGAIARGNLAITVSAAGATSTLAAVSLSDVRLGNIVKDSGGIIATITDIDDLANTITTSPALANTGAATIYKDSFGAGTAPLTKNTFILAVRDGDETLIGSDDAEENTFEDRNLKLIRGGTWDWGGSVAGNLAVNANGGTSTHFTMGTNIWYGQKFTTTSAGNLTSGSMYLEGSSAPTGSIVLKIFSDAAGLPGTLLGTSAPVNAATLYSGGLPFAAQVFTFAPIALTNATVYHAVLDVSGWTGGTLQYEGTPTDTYAGGNVVKSVDTGASYAAFTGEDLKLSIDGTVSGASGILTWSSDAFIQIPGLPEARNKVAAGNVSIPTDGDVAYVNINRFPGANATLAITVAAISSLISTEDLLIIARRVGTDVIVGNQSTLLKAGQSTELYAQASDQSLSFMGAGSTADNSPNYASNNYVVDGTSLETAIGALDTSLAAVSGVVTAIQWKAPVANVAALPVSGNTDGDVRLTLDTRVAYTWHLATTSWKPVNGTGGGVKIIGGGTLTWTAPNLTFTADMYLEIKGLAYADNTIAFSTQSPIALASSLDVAYVIPNLATGGPSLVVTVGALSSVPANAIIIARREGADAIVGSSSTRLKEEQSTEIYAQESIQSRNTLRSIDFLRSNNPVTWTGTQLEFTSNIVLESLNTRTGATKLTTMLTANSPVVLANGEMAYIIIDRTAGSSNALVNISATVDIIASEKQEHIILAKRVDVGGTGYLHLPLHKQVLSAGQTVRLGASGGADTIDVLAGENLAANDAVYVSKGNANGDTGRTLGRAYKLDVSDDNRMEFVGFVKLAATSGNSVSIQVLGELSGFSGLTEGIPLWADYAAPGGYTQTAPSTLGNWLVPIGMATSTTEALINAAGAATAIFLEATTFSFTVANNTASQNITSLSMNGAVTRALRVSFSLRRRTDTALSEVVQVGEMRAWYNTQAATYSITTVYSGDDCGATFTITSGGQIQVSTTNITGTTYIGEMRFTVEQFALGV